MLWLLFAFAAPMLWAASTHIDKFLVDSYFARGSVVGLLLYTSATGLLLAAAILVLRPNSWDLPLQSVSLMTASGVLTMVAMLFYLGALQTEPASSVVPWFQTAPLFGYALGYLILHETLSPHQIVGGGAIIAGAIGLSLNDDAAHRNLKVRLAVMMLICAFFIALSTAIFKLFAIEDEFWTTTAWTSVGQALFGLTLLVHPPSRRQVREMLGASTRRIAVVNAFNEVINLGGALAQRYALLLAPLSLVQAIGSTGPVFVFVFGLVLSFIRPQLRSAELSSSSLLRKAAAILVITTGVILISS